MKLSLKHANISRSNTLIPNINVFVLIRTVPVWVIFLRRETQVNKSPIQAGFIVTAHLGKSSSGYQSTLMVANASKSTVILFP